eukprot:TRINITY_DN18060_c0_g1_i1.p1 TRINITY_DN18060_c0_g1~~TRINITY_DN18060_c0_g1_i1.p1  ORF type:complete len:341 (+),score=43.42 TRINITY_DN18060_c0_g1_i1:80-1102(+)
MADVKQPPSTAPTTWGGMLSAYCSEKQVVPPLESRFRFTRKNGGGVKEKERMFNPVTQRHRDSETEKKVRQAELNTSVADINKGMKVALTKESCIGYNLINQQPKFGIKEVADIGFQENQKGKRIAHPKQGTGFNISNQSDPTGTPAPPRKTKQGQRQYNVLQHRYIRNHESTLESQGKAILERSQKIILSNYDPIRARHNNPEKEKIARDAISDLMETKKKEYHTSTKRTPVIEKRSEGHNYDIINGSVYNRSGVQTLDSKLMGSTIQKMKMRETVSSNLSAREVEASKSDARAVSRISSQRLSSHNYNIVTGADVSRLPAIPRPQQPESVWGVLAKTM